MSGGELVVIGSRRKVPASRFDPSRKLHSHLGEFLYIDGEWWYDAVTPNTIKMSSLDAKESDGTNMEDDRSIYEKMMQYPLSIVSIRMCAFVSEVRQVRLQTGKPDLDPEYLKFIYREYSHPEQVRSWSAIDIENCQAMLSRLGFSVRSPMELNHLLPPKALRKSGEPVERANVLVWPQCGQELGIDMDALLETLNGTKMDCVKWSRRAAPESHGLQNKIARHNACFTDLQETVFDPDPGDVSNTAVRHKHPKNATIKFTNFKFQGELAAFRLRFARILGPFGYKVHRQFAELNKYYDASCGIGWHGDVERGHGDRAGSVNCLKVGRAIPLCFGWYRNSRPVPGPSDLPVSGHFPMATKKGKGWQSTTAVRSLLLGHGDLYMMSRKAVGHDWKKKDYALRHSAGHWSYTKIDKAWYATVPTEGPAYSLTFSDTVENDSETPELQFSTPYR